MRPYTRWVILMMGCITFALSGCSKETVDDGAEGGEGTAQADTAAVEGAVGGVETLPSVDQGTAESGGDAAFPTPVPAEGTASTDSQAAPATPEPVAGTGEIVTYTVQRGDTLMKIAFNLYGDIMKWRDLHELNKDTLADANRLERGMKIKYDKPASEPTIERNGDPYMIKKGDTLGTISGDVYGTPTKWKKLWENNRTLIKDPNRIYAGFYLYYQISEQEKQEVEQLKASRGQQLGGGGTTSGSDASAPAAPSQGDGGLNNLAAPPSDRTPTGN